jgi:hypothetical protein
MGKTTLFLFLILMGHFSFSQNDSIVKTKGNPELAKHSHAISVRAFLGFDYEYAYAISEHSGLGFSAGLGLGGNIFLYHPDYKPDYRSYLKQFDFTSSSPIINLQLLQFSAFYRRHVSKNVCADLGFRLSGSYVFIIAQKLNFGRFLGGYLSVYYGKGKFKFGHELQIGDLDIEFYNKATSGPSILFTPLIIKFIL